ncbi:protein of unknown function [Azospirillum baldaniorum]|uniref:Uncharacterized protein n=1 Tax=Azospirillum baldaniorum TaxID=1064539 RepID=A0A9P1NL54_9PROT|nr:protein of unknown function [Azospirillum baldaniorum]
MLRSIRTAPETGGADRETASAATASPVNQTPQRIVSAAKDHRRAMTGLKPLIFEPTRH